MPVSTRNSLRSDSQIISSHVPAKRKRSEERQRSLSIQEDTFDDISESTPSTEPIQSLTEETLPLHPRRLPRLKKLFTKNLTYEEIQTLARKTYPPKTRKEHVPLYSDNLLFSEDEVQKLVAERYENLTIELCDFPDHQRMIERLKAENDVLRSQLRYEKSKNATLAGELAEFKGLAYRVLNGDRIEKSWNSAQDAFVRLIGRLLRWREE